MFELNHIKAKTREATKSQSRFNVAIILPFFFLCLVHNESFRSTKSDPII